MTCYNRHPDIFNQAKALLPSEKPVRVLSFGCSSGEEVSTLRDLGSPHWTVDGAEFQPKLLAKAREKDPKGLYVVDAGVLPAGIYDAIFCMSVLCRYQAPPEDFPFQSFERVLGTILEKLKPGGLLVIYNAQYDPREVSFAQKLEPLQGHDWVGSGFVPKFNKAMTEQLSPRAANRVPYLYRKRCSKDDQPEAA